MRIYYIGYFDFQDSDVPRRYIVSAVNKMLYISKVLQNISPSFQILSLSLPTGDKFFYRHRLLNNNGIKCLFFPFFGFIRGEKYKDIWRGLCLFCYGFTHFQKDDVVVSYHSTSRASHCLVLLRRIKKIKLVLEVEEIYSDLVSSVNEIRKRENESISNCDGYIFSTDFLERKINTKHLPSVVIYGTYQVDNYQHTIENNQIHVVYAGTFDPRKGGVNAAAAAEYLPNNYTLHICGFGTESQTEDIKKIVSYLQKKGCGIVYEGLLKGQAYLDLLHRCQIGLSPQDPTAKFNGTSFPSKILSYMASGLAVVSIRIAAIENSKVGKYICFYESQTPEEIAESIMMCDISQGTRNRDVIASLDEEFQLEMSNVITDLLSN